MIAHYLDHYDDARADFLQKGKNLAAKQWALPLAATGPDGLELSIDIAWIGPPQATRALIHCSGLHGIEGVCGSAIQRALMADLPALPPDTALILVHAMNPYGWSWRRRVNESNVDLNRNFLAPNRPYEGAPDGYAEMDRLLNPPSPPSMDFYYPRAAWSVLRHGFNSLKQAVVGGQYAFPKGLFFGGAQLEEGPTAYSAWVAENLQDLERLVVLDIHTGLGPTAYDTLLVDVPARSPQEATLAQAFQHEVVPWDPDAGVAYAIEGAHMSLYERLLSARTNTVTQEFGTRKSLAVLKALREENRLHLHGQPAIDHPAKVAMLETFAPTNKAWRSEVLERGLRVANQALALLTD
ncbi:MAG: hypothetical protein ACI9VR_000391 [Cognaticolwellia sp.]|jgi:hypothetical protein